MDWLQFWETASYVVTVIGLPFAIAIFIFEQRKERDNEEEEAYQVLSDAYRDFLKLVLANPDLKLRSTTAAQDLSDEQRERQLVIFEMLISLFERAYLLAYEEDMSPRQARRWQSWDDYMREWCQRQDFRELLPRLMQGEDLDFGRYIQRIAGEEQNSPGGFMA
jgi:hypothetical protein